MRLTPIIQPLTEPLLSPLVTAITGASGGGFSPISLFTASEKGYIYDNDDYVNPTTWRRNLLTYSEQFDNAAWAKANASVTANTTTAPDGTTTADSFIENGLAGNHYIGQSPTVLAGPHTFSVYYKLASGARNIALYHAGVNQGRQFDASGNSSAGVFNAPAAFAVTAVGNGWYRASITVTLTAGASQFRIWYSDAGNNLSYTGDSTSGYYLWGAQLEAGSAATTYQRITDFNSDFLAAYPNTTMFVDSAGTQPALVNGLVGLQLDKSGGLALGAELVTNGDFSSATGWTVTPTAPATGSISGGVFTFNSPAGESVFASQNILTVGKWYKVTVVVTAFSGGIRITPGSGGTIYTITAIGTHTFNLLANGSDGIFFISRSGVSSGTVDSVSVRELPGNHRYQTTTGSKPILRGTPVGGNLVTNGDFASGTTGWAAANSAVVTATGGRLRIQNNVVDYGQAYTTFSAEVGRVYRITAKVFLGTSTSARIHVGNSIGSLNVLGESFSADTTAVRYIVANATTMYLTFQCNTINDTAYIEVDDVEIVDVSASAVTAPYGLQYDGIDDFLTTASVDFTATDKMAVVMGVRKLSDAAAGTLVELSADPGANNGSFGIRAPQSAAANFGATVKGAATAFATATTNLFAAPYAGVLSQAFNLSGASADEIVAAMRVNGTAVAPWSPSGTAGSNFGNYPLYFGRRGGTSNPYNGLDFGGVCVGKSLTATQLASVEKWVSLRTGVTI